jgi:hypothetical protein
VKRVFFSSLAALALASGSAPAGAANVTPDQLTQATGASAGDLMLIYPSGGPMKSVQWSVVTSLIQSALGGTFLQAGNNLADVPSPSSARNNLGLGGAATQNTGTSGAVLPFLNGANSWSGAQTFNAASAFNGKVTLFAGSASGAPLNIPQGAAPSTPANGDCWTTSADLFCQLGGSTQQYLTAASAAATYAPLASPALSGSPTAPTPGAGSNSTALATTAFVAASFAPLASPALSGVPTAPTAANGTNTTQIATTAFVLANGSAPKSAEFAYSVSSGTAADFSSLTTTAWNQRHLNTTLSNGIAGASLSSNRVTLPAGTYLVTYVESFDAASTPNVFALGRIRDTTAGATYALSPAVFTPGSTISGTFASANLTASSIVTLSASDALEVDIFPTAAAGGGNAGSTGDNEVYVRLTVVKIG